MPPTNDGMVMDPARVVEKNMMMQEWEDEEEFQEGQIDQRSCCTGVLRINTGDIRYKHVKIYSYIIYLFICAASPLPDP